MRPIQEQSFSSLSSQSPKYDNITSLQCQNLNIAHSKETIYLQKIYDQIRYLNEINVDRSIGSLLLGTRIKMFFKKIWTLRSENFWQKNSLSRRRGAVWPGDQFVFSIYLAIYCNENLPKSIQIVPKWFENFAQKPINLKYIAKYLRKWWNFAKSGHTDEEEM